MSSYPSIAAEENRKVKYPNSFVFGFASGILLQICTRAATYEPLSARPFSYITVGLVLGSGMWYYDYWRRRAMDEVMYAEQRRNYHYTVKAMNRVRHGEEEEIVNLVEYLATTTVRE